MTGRSFNVSFIVLGFTGLMGLLASSCRGEEQPASPKSALKLFVLSLQAGDADKAIKGCRFDEGDEGTAEKDIVRAAAESMEAFNKLADACLKKWPESYRNIDDDDDKKPHVTGPKSPWLGEVDLAKEVINGDVAELTCKVTRMRVKLVKAGDVWLVEPAQFLRPYSCDPGDPANGFREYTKLAKQLQQDVSANKIDSFESEQTALRDRLGFCQIAIEKMRKHAGQ